MVQEDADNGTDREIKTPQNRTSPVRRDSRPAAEILQELAGRTNPESKYKQLVAEQERYLAQGGIIYADEFQELEGQDSRYKVAVDLDGVLTEDGQEDDTLTLRPKAQEFLDAIGQHKDEIKLILWTASTRERTERVARLLGIQESFDLIITKENYDLRTGFDVDQQKENRRKFPAAHDFQEKYSAAKPLSDVGYDVLLDDTHGLESARVNGFELIRVPTFIPKFRRPTPFPSDVVSKLIAAAE